MEKEEIVYLVNHSYAKEEAVTENLKALGYMEDNKIIHDYLKQKWRNIYIFEIIVPLKIYCVGRFSCRNST